jgi:hypothetical protein
LFSDASPSIIYLHLEKLQQEKNSMTDKTPNYTDEMVARLHAVYDGEADEATRDEQVGELAEELGKSPASIRAKLTREGIYVPKNKAPAGKASVTKADLIAVIASKLGRDEDVVGSLEKANKVVLSMLVEAL